MAHVPRLYCPQAKAVGQTLTATPEQAHHLLRVLRRRDGDPVCLFAPPDREFDAQLAVPERQTAVLTVTAQRRVTRESPLTLTLVQGIARGERMDFSIQKSVELGVAAIQPVFTRRGGMQLAGARLTRKQAHWQAVAQSAAEQTGRTVVPPVHPAVDLEKHLTAGPHSGFLLSPDGAKTWPGQPPAGPLALLIGPEGGLDDDEIEKARAAGYTPLRLGPRILRTETAGLAALAALQTRWGDFGG